MQDLSVLTPPLLVCAAVIVGIVAFLRHEMKRGGRRRSDADGDNPGALTDPHEGEAGESGSDDVDSSAGSASER